MFAISPTDNNWFEFLKGLEFNSYVNFWTPTPWNVQRLNVPDRWYFLLKSPYREIAGFGEFVEYKNLTANEAWEEFGQRNGRIDKQSFTDSIQHYIDKNSSEFGGATIDVQNYKLGCIILKNCEFWDEEAYKKPSKYGINFANQVVKFKYFDQEDPFNKEQAEILNNFIPLIKERDENKREVNQRKGQGVFKGKLLKAYNNKCCISGETCPELLEAAHIQRYLDEDSNHVQNGIILRVDLHRLLDSGLLTIDENYIVHISKNMASESYSKFHNQKIYLPNKTSDHPSKVALQELKRNFRY